jgi:hypothetical protein
MNLVLLLYVLTERKKEKEKLFRSSLHADCMKGGWLIRNFTRESSREVGVTSRLR